MKKIEVIGRVEQLYSYHTASDNADIAVIIVDLIPPIELLYLAQFDREGVYLAVIVGPLQRLLL